MTSPAADAPLPDRDWVAILVNPFSGAGANLRHASALADALRGHGLEARLVTDPAERKTVLADPALPARCRAVVAAGGDGTVADALNEGLPAAGVPLAILPLGNENLLAKEFGFTRDPDRLARAIAAGHTRRVDLGWAQPLPPTPAAETDAGPTTAAASRLRPAPPGRYFSLMVSAGVDADIVHRLAKWRQAHTGLRRVRHRSYARHALAAWLRYGYPRLELETDTGLRVRGAQALIFNAPRYGLGLRFTDTRGCDDGLLDWVVFERPGRWMSLRYLWAVARGQHLPHRDVKHGRSKRIVVRGDVFVPVQRDGDPSGTTPMEITVLPAALSVIHVG